MLFFITSLPEEGHDKYQASAPDCHSAGAIWHLVTGSIREATQLIIYLKNCLKIKTYFLLITLLLNSCIAYADFFQFTGVEIGEDWENIKKEYPKPDQIQKKDHSSMYAFFDEDKKRYKIIEVGKDGKVVRVQVTGNTPLKDESLNGIQLGDSKEKLFKNFGEPDESEFIDEKWGTVHHFRNSNFSFETNKGIVTSISVNRSLKATLMRILFYEFKKEKYKSKDERIRYMLGFGNYFKSKDNYHAAIAMFDLLLETDPNNIAAIVNRANSFKEIKRYDVALTEYSKALKLSPDNYIILYNIGLSLYHTFEYTGAIKHFKLALKAIETPSSKIEPVVGKKQLLISCLMNLGNVYDDAGDLEMAFEYYDLALAIDNDNLYVLYNYAVAYKNDDQYAEAIRKLDKILKIDPGFERGIKLLNEIQDIQMNSNDSTRKKSKNKSIHSN